VRQAGLAGVGDFDAMRGGRECLLDLFGNERSATSSSISSRWAMKVLFAVGAAVVGPPVALSEGGGALSSVTVWIRF
jgi:hypothetical protein